MKGGELSPVVGTCPVCQGTQVARLYTVTSEAAARHFIPKSGEQYEQLRCCIEHLWGGTRCEVVRCLGCRFGFAIPFVAGDAEFYQLAYPAQTYPAHKWEYERTYGVLTADGGSPPRLLEIGAGDGAFIRRITPALTPPHQVVCTEYSEFGRARIEKAGVRCLAADVRELGGEDLGGCFDVICLFQVLEHMDRLDQLFEALGRVGCPSAQCFIAVPNAQAIEFNEGHGALLDMPPNHIGRWQEACFEVMASRHRWTVQAVAIEPEPFFPKAARFLYYQHLRRAQHPGFARRAQGVRRRGGRLLAAAMETIVHVPAALPALIALRSRALGGSMWVHLRRGRQQA